MHASTGLGMSVAEVEARCLADACASVKKQAFYMNKAIEGDNLKDALRYAALLLGELRTGELQPQRYFELYMQVQISLVPWFVTHTRRKCMGRALYPDWWSDQWCFLGAVDSRLK